MYQWQDCFHGQTVLAFKLISPRASSDRGSFFLTWGIIALQCCVSSALKQHASSVCTQIYLPFRRPFTLPSAHPTPTHLGHPELPVLLRRRSSLRPSATHIGLGNRARSFHSRRILGFEESLGRWLCSDAPIFHTYPAK